MFPENVFICPDVEELLSGKHLSEQPAIIDSSFDTKPDDGVLFNNDPSIFITRARVER